MPSYPEGPKVQKFNTVHFPSSFTQSYQVVLKSLKVLGFLPLCRWCSQAFGTWLLLKIKDGIQYLIGAFPHKGSPSSSALSDLHIWRWSINHPNPVGEIASSFDREVMSHSPTHILVALNFTKARKFTCETSLSKVKDLVVW
ncbi:hypothetical protein R6Q59_023950 [Mikania micrantha]